MSSCKDVLIVGELIDDFVSTTTKELLTIGRSLADSLDENLAITLLGENTSQHTDDLLPFGVPSGKETLLV